MSEAVEQLSGKLGIDTSDFKTAIREANRELRVLESGFRASAATLGDWADDASGLESRLETLTKKMDIQKLKVNALREEHQRLADANGENSIAAKEAEIKLNKETETLNKMERELRDTNDQLEEMKGDAERAAKGVDKLDDEQKQATSSSLTLKGAMHGLGTGIQATATAAVAAVKAVAAITVAVAALALGVAAYTVGPASDLQETISKSETVFGDYADGVIENAKRADTALGVSQQQYLDYASALGAALMAGGASVEDATALSEQAVGHFADLASFHNEEVADMAGAWQSAVRGSFEPIQKVFPFITNEFLKTFGVSNGLVDEQTENLTANQRAIILNAIALDSTLNPALGDFERTSGGLANQQRSLQATFENIRTEIGGALLPVVTELTTQLNEFLQSDTGRTVIDTITEGIGSLANLLQDFNLGEFLGNLFGGFADNGANVANIGLDIINGLIDGLTGSLGNLAPLAIQILEKLIQFITTGLPALIQAGIPMLLALVTGLLEALPLILQAAIDIIIALAQGLTTALPTLIPAIVQAIITIVQTLLENLPMLIDAALQLILALADGLILALPVLIAALPQIIGAILGALIDALPLILGAAGELIGMLATGIVANIPLVLLAIGELIFVLARRLADWIQTMPELGKSLLAGIWKGIQDNAGRFWAQVSGFFEGILQNIKDTLGMHSPSDEGIDIGENLIGSVGIGGMHALASVKRQLSDAMKSLSTDMSANASLSVAGLGAGRSGAMSVSIGDIIVQVGGSNASPVEIGRATENGVLKALRAVGAA